MLLDAKEIHNWSDKPEAPFTLPILIRRLLLATLTRPTVINTPGGSGVYLPGFDGTIVSEGGLFIPSGNVVLELSSNDDVINKANSDYRKRTDALAEFDKKNTSFIFITSRTFSTDAKKKWIEEKNRENQWKEINFIDANDLIQWLEMAPIVFSWFIRLIGKVPPGGYGSLADWWEHWAGVTKPSTIPDIVVAGRTESMNHVHTWLINEASPFYIQGETTDEALAFFMSSCLLDSSLADIVLSKAVVVDTLDAWNVLSKETKPLLLIPRFDDDFAVNNATARGHHILFVLEKGDNISGQGECLPRTKRSEFIDALIKMGLTYEEAETIARSTGRHLPSVRRKLIARAGGIKPSWAISTEANKLIPALFLGKWTESQNDLSLLASFSKNSVDEILGEYQGFTNIPDSPLRKVGSAWRLTCHEEAWELLSPFITKYDLDLFVEKAFDAFSEDSPALELEQGQRYMASMFDKVPRYSGSVKEGMATTLALMACKSEGLSHSLEIVPIIVIRKLVEQGKNNWKFWATMGSLLPEFAEAAPAELLAGIEDTLTSSRDTFAELFNQEGKDPLFGACYHSGLLWALEKLAWSEEYFTRACDALVKLSEIDPGGRYANRPIESLSSLFQGWVRFSEVSDENRIKVLKNVCSRHKTIGWKLQQNSLPHAMSGITSREMPYWRNWAQDFKQPSRQEASVYSQQIVGILIESLQNEPSQWEEVLNIITRFNDDTEVEGMIDKLSEILKSETDLLEWLEVRTTIRRELHLHREHSEQDWALPPSILSKLQTIYDLLEPSDPVLADSWIFNHWVDLPEGGRKTDQETKNRALELQTESLKKIFSFGGKEGIEKLIDTAPHSTLVGSIAIEHIENKESIFDIVYENLENDSQAFQNFCFGVMHVTYLKEGWTGLTEFINEAKNRGIGEEGIAKIFLVAKANKNTWEALQNETDKVQKLYWELIASHCLERNQPVDFEFGINKLLDYNRSPEVVHSIAYADIPFSKDTLIRTLELLPKNLDTLTNAEKPINIAPYDIAKVFTKLDKVESDLGIISKLEIPFVSTLSQYRKNLALHREITNNASIFADLIAWLYKRSDDKIDNMSFSDEERKNAVAASYHILEGIHIIPGTQLDGSIDELKLLGWVQDAIRLCGERAREAAAKRYIGKILANSHVGKDGIWPCVEVRKVLDEYKDKEMGLAFTVGKKNLRGVVSRSPFDGGIQERDLANTFKNYANKTRIDYPFTSKLLSEIGNFYEDQAKQEDRRAEWNDS